MTRPIRSGSYPLMNLAEDFGVDYGDVLLLADGYRAVVLEEPFPPGRELAFLAAHMRVFDKLGRLPAELHNTLLKFAHDRWGGA